MLQRTCCLCTATYAPDHGVLCRWGIVLLTYMHRSLESLYYYARAVFVLLRMRPITVSFAGGASFCCYVHAPFPNVLLLLHTCIVPLCPYIAT
jgi:hypothetical protein